MVMSQGETKAKVKDELMNALAYFIERQKLVAQALVELGLDLNEVAEFKSAAWSSGTKLKGDNSHIASSSPENAQVQELFQVATRASERNLSQSGIWQDHENNEWQYFLHGGGCRLINRKTGEPIDWDCPDVNSYDKYKFLHHLEWQLSSSERADKFPVSRRIEKAELESLINEIVQ
jgi:hypothetical protein